MTVQELARQLLSPEEEREWEAALEELREEAYPLFYNKNQEIIHDLLFLDTMDEFLDFLVEEPLEEECFHMSFLCHHGYGIQIGGYEEDAGPALAAFLEEKGLNSPELQAFLKQGEIQTDGEEDDSFKASISALNQLLNDGFGVRFLVLEDGTYCDCQYSLLLLKKALWKEAHASWESENFLI